MKTLLLFFTLTAAASSFAQGVSVTDLQTRAKADKLKEIVIAYDKFKDKAIVATKPQNLVGSNEGAMAIFATGMIGPNRAMTTLYLQVGYEFKGQTLDATPTHYAVIFTSNSSNWNFLKGDTNLYILYDEHRLELHPVAEDRELKTGITAGPSRVSVAEQLGFGITRADLENIIKAKKVEIKLGDTKPRTWKADWSKRLAQLLDITMIK